jgi:hypothetical protein
MENFFRLIYRPFAYNETIAQEYFPKSEKEIKEKGFTYRISPEKEYTITLRSEDLPDHIRDTPDSIINEIISCPNQGSVLTQCTSAYRIIKSELDFLKK